jgi:hypothetical protein
MSSIIVSTSIQILEYKLLLCQIRKLIYGHGPRESQSIVLRNLPDIALIDTLAITAFVDRQIILLIKLSPSRKSGIWALYNGIISRKTCSE